MGLLTGVQVRLLLKELEESRGRVVKMTYDTDGSPAVGSSSSILITDKLVTFRSVSTLFSLTYALCLHSGYH